MGKFPHSAPLPPVHAGVPEDSDLLSCLLGHIPDRIYFKDRAGRFLCVSGAEAIYLGARNPQEVIGKTDFDFFAPELAQAAFDDEKRVMQTGEAITGKVERKLLLDGRTGWALVAKIPLRDALGELIGTCGISKDITELKDTEEALHVANADLESQRSKLEQALSELRAAQQRLIEFEKIQWIGRLAFGVAHEIRNPLGVLEMGLTFLGNLPALAGAEQAQTILHEMGKAIRRADVVIGALMDGAGSSGVKVNPRDVPEIVERAVKMMKSAHGQDEGAGPLDGLPASSP